MIHYFFIFFLTLVRAKHSLASVVQEIVQKFEVIPSKVLSDNQMITIQMSGSSVN